MQTLKIGDRVLEIDGAISIIRDIEDRTVFGCKFQLESGGFIYWINYFPIKITPLIEALL